jgi:hypothetical protein
VAFVRYKTVKGKKYYQIVRNYREDGKHKQEVLCHLGAHRSLEEAIDAARASVEQVQAKISYWSEGARYWLEEAQHTAASIREVYGDDLDDAAPTWRVAWAFENAVHDEYDPHCSAEEWQRWNKRRNAATQLVTQTERLRDAAYSVKYCQELLAEHRRTLAKRLEVRE